MKTLGFGYVALSAGVATLLAACGGSPSPIGAPGVMAQRARLPQSTVGRDSGAEFAYVADYESGNVSAYRIYSDGTMTHVHGSPFAAGGGPLSVAVDPGGTYLYVANEFGSTSSISGYAIDPTSGVLTPIKGSPFPSGFTSNAIAIDPAGRFLYVTNWGTASAGYVSAYTINRANGALTEVKGSPFAAAIFVDSIIVDPTGRFVYAGRWTGFPSYSTPTIYGYIVNQRSGALKPMHGSPFGAGGMSLSMAVDRTGHLYSVNGGTASSGGSIWAFNIDPKGGELLPVTGSPFMTRQQASSGIAVDPTGKFAYVSDYVEGGGNIGELSAYEIESSGALKQVKGSPFAVGRNAHPLGVAIDPSGTFVYLADHGRAQVSAYQIGRKGVPKKVTGSPYGAGKGPNGIAICRVTSGKCVPPPL